jgi:hypothetical protein
MASIRIDSYHDSRTAFEFTFNVAGVKVDIVQYDDGEQEDDSWDAVWDVQTRITDEGWEAEIKIPFSVSATLLLHGYCRTGLRHQHTLHHGGKNSTLAMCEEWPSSPGRTS